VGAIKPPKGTTIMPFQPNLEDIKNTTVQAVTLEISEEYADLHPIAQALIIGDNASAILAELVEASIESKQAQAEIVEIWQDMESVGKLASIRTLLNRQSKKLLGFPLTVKDGQLIEAPTRKTKKDELTDGEGGGESANDVSADDELTRVKRWFKSADASKRQQVLELIAKLG